MPRYPAIPDGGFWIDESVIASINEGGTTAAITLPSVTDTDEQASTTPRLPVTYPGHPRRERETAPRGSPPRKEKEPPHNVRLAAAFERL
jgi:hypothetical protein